MSTRKANMRKQWLGPWKLFEGRFNSAWVRPYRFDHGAMWMIVPTQGSWVSYVPFIRPSMDYGVTTHVIQTDIYDLSADLLTAK